MLAVSAPLHRIKKNNKIWKHAKNGNWKRATRLCLRQSLCQFRRMFPDFYFSKFYSEVAACANTSPQKGFRKNSGGLFATTAIRKRRKYISIAKYNKGFVTQMYAPSLTQPAHCKLSGNRKTTGGIYAPATGNCPDQSVF